MPRVSEEYLERRRQQILDAARRCFARKGFYETSMQDVFAESGLSPGAVYRYFQSKDELIRAIAAGAFERIGAVIEDALAEEPVPGLDDIAGRVAAAVQEMSGADGPARIGPAAWAAALHNPAVAEVVTDAFGELRASWVRAVRRMADDGRLPAGTDVEAAGSALLALLPGFLVQHLIIGAPDAAGLRRGLSALLRPEAVSSGPELSTAAAGSPATDDSSRHSRWLNRRHERRLMAGGCHGHGYLHRVRRELRHAGRGRSRLPRRRRALPGVRADRHL